MRGITIAVVLMLLTFLAVPAKAASLEAPEPPDSAYQWMPSQTDRFGEGLLEVIQKGVSKIHPELKEAAGVALTVIACAMLVSMLTAASDTVKVAANLSAVAAVSAALFLSTNAMIRMGADTVRQLSEYGKLLLPVMTAAMAAYGGISSATALYTGTAVFDAILCAALSKVLIPMVYAFLVLSAADSVTAYHTLKKMKELLKNGITWFLKTCITVFISYMGVTGIISGTTDAAALKATKTAISTAVPVVGGILSGASEAVLVGAQLAKNAAGIYGIFALLAIFLEPFLKTGIHYLILKLAAAVCGILDAKSVSDLVGDYSSAMGFVLGMTGSVCVLQLVSTVCFMKGMG